MHNDIYNSNKNDDFDGGLISRADGGLLVLQVSFYFFFFT